MQRVGAGKGRGIRRTGGARAVADPHEREACFAPTMEVRRAGVVLPRVVARIYFDACDCPDKYHEEGFHLCGRADLAVLSGKQTCKSTRPAAQPLAGFKAKLERECVEVNCWVR